MRPLILHLARRLRPQPEGVRRDPAPSRWAYRMQRLWLTPFVRRLTRVGVPSFLIAFSVGIYLSDDTRRENLGQTFASLRDSMKSRPEFMVTLLSVEGASAPLAAMVRDTLAIPLPISSLDLDLKAAHDRVMALPAVRSVTLRIRSGGILEARIEEREPALVWRAPQGLILLDAEGHPIAGIERRSARADLPLIAGQGADRAAPEALALIAAAAPLTERLRGLVRMGERRWDLVLDRDQRILLPEENPVQALESLIALDQAQQVLARDILAVDLRLPDRPALRLGPHALTELRRASGILPAHSESEL